MILCSGREAAFPTFPRDAVIFHIPAFVRSTGNPRSGMALRLSLIRHYPPFWLKKGSTLGLRLCLRSSVLTPKAGRHGRAAAMPVNSHADPKNGGGCGFACELPCRPQHKGGIGRAAVLPANSHADSNKKKGQHGGLRPGLRTSMLRQTNKRRHWGGWGLTCEPPCRPQKRLARPPY